MTGTNNKPVVNLISKPENMLKTVYTACRTCYSADYPINIYNSTDDEEKMLKLIERVISSGHYSTIEHIQVSFAISNVSRFDESDIASFNDFTSSSYIALKSNKGSFSIMSFFIVSNNSVVILPCFLLCPIYIFMEINIRIKFYSLFTYHPKIL